MRERKCTQIEKRMPTSASRRSPRFSSVAQRKRNGDSENGNRKDSRSKSLGRSGGVYGRSTRSGGGVKVRSPDMCKEYVIEKRVTRSSAGGVRFGDNQKTVTNFGVGISAGSGEGCRRSGRLNDRGGVRNTENVQDLQGQRVMEKRVTRSSIRGNNREKNKADGFDDKQVKVSIEERATLSFNQTEMASVMKACNDSTDIVAPNGKKPKGNGGMSNPCILKRDAVGCHIERESDVKNCERRIKIDEGNKYQVEGDCGIAQSWTEEQESALQRAYFTAKPTPHFWKKVSRMVPGKSAKECFDRIQSDLATPSQPRPRSRANRNNASPPVFSASKLLGPAETKMKRIRPSRRTLLAQKTVRQILRKQCNEDQTYKADFFAVLEPKVDLLCLNLQLGTPFTSPEQKQSLGILERCGEMSSSADKKQNSRMIDSQKLSFISPPVLKQIRNKALHEKYIDKLHCRDAKRNSEALRHAKCIQEKNGSPSRDNSTKVAKDVLVSDAQDVINWFRSLQPIKDNLDDDTDLGGDDEDEE